MWQVDPSSLADLGGQDGRCLTQTKVKADARKQVNLWLRRQFQAKAASVLKVTIPKASMRLHILKGAK